MSQVRTDPSDLEVRYPFAPRSRRFFDTMPFDESLASRTVVAQAEARLMSALGKMGYDAHLSKQIEFSSFFAAALVASQDRYVTNVFSKREGERAKSFFMRERQAEKPLIFEECFATDLDFIPGEGRHEYSMSFEKYLTLASKYDLMRASRWKLVKQTLGNGKVYLTDNTFNDLFGDSSEKMVADGVQNLRRGAFPRQLLELRTKVLSYVPTPKVKPGRGYLYIEELMKHPVSDGRHRLVWLVLAPYLVNVRLLEEDEAIEKIKGYVSALGEVKAMKRFVEYNVRRAKRNGLMPPTLKTLKTEHPDLYSLLPTEVVSLEPRG